MRVSIIIPTFNRAVYLESAISSALAQDYPDLEVVISDNNSTDNTEAVSKVYLRDPRVKYFRNSQNIGMVRNWQRAVFERATGEWFLILSDDDILTNPQFVSQAMKIVQKAENITVVYSSSYVYDEALNTVTKLSIPFRSIEDGKVVFSQRGTVRPQDFALCNVLFNKKMSMEMEAFGNVSNLSCDTELFLRLCLRGKVGVVPEYSSIYRVHSDNLLKSVNKNSDFVIGSLDSLVKPLVEAQRKNIEESILSTFVENSGIRREILVSLLKLSATSKEKAIQLYADLKRQLNGENFNVLPSKLLFCLILSLGAALSPLMVVRRRMIYVLNNVKRLIFGSQVYFEPLQKRVYLIE